MESTLQTFDREKHTIEDWRIANSVKMTIGCCGQAIAKMCRTKGKQPNA
jgi:hypothetical protein